MIAIFLSCCKNEALDTKISSSSTQNVSSSFSDSIYSSSDLYISSSSIDSVDFSSATIYSSSDLVFSSSGFNSSSSILESSSSEKAKKEILMSGDSNVDSSQVVKDSVENKEDNSLCADIPENVLCDLRDGQIYKTIRIGSQIWMAQNLNYAVENSWCYRNSIENCSVYGRLYQWASALNLDKSYNHTLAGSLIENSHQGICPDSWRLPNHVDMQILVNYIQTKNKENGFETENVGTSLRKNYGWEDNDDEVMGTDRFQFGALAAGYRDASGAFAFLGEETNFWIAEESNSGVYAPYWNLYYGNQSFLGDYKNLKTFAFSVRCIKM